MRASNLWLGFGLMAIGYPAAVHDGICAEDTAGSHAMIHATYAVGNRLKNKAQIEKTRFLAFDFIHLVAGPEWEAEDFGGTNERAMRRLVEEHAYPHGESGEALVPLFIQQAHAADTRVLLSLPLDVLRERKRKRPTKIHEMGRQPTVSETELLLEPRPDDQGVVGVPI